MASKIAGVMSNKPAANIINAYRQYTYCKRRFEK
jgi:hypothetical protein